VPIITPAVHKKIFRWYTSQQRSFPWRTTRAPYRILLSEIMAQQTQVRRVAVYYRRWLKRFPTFTALAGASVSDVLREWSGLGYNSRALRFHQLAKFVSSELHSRLPRSTDELMKLPGIGRYTAHAVACFAFEAHVPVVDVNIKRILTRYSKRISSSSEMMNDDDAWVLAERSLPKQNAYDWNQALMDLGGTVCTARNPKCSECPVNTSCASAFSKIFLQKQIKKKKVEPSWKGIPRRIYRGKILKLLHFHSLSAEEIAGILWENSNSKDVVWLNEVLGVMVKNGLLSMSKKIYSITH
jgi:A/G-specific adenine glycosylase